ncbi:MAG: shikimate dehydrogenase family protein, partial [Angustibacter sp.]
MLAAVLGSPIGHSLSPTLHRAAYAALGLADWEYTAIEAANQADLRRLLDAGPWAGWSLTMPLKTEVQPLLPELSAVAEATGAVNTVLFSAGADPRPVLGDNTDVLGIVRSLGELGFSGGPAVVLGSGATACSAVAALIELGVSCPRVVLRSVGRAGGVRACAERLGAEVEVIPWERGAAAIRASAVVV